MQAIAAFCGGRSLHGAIGCSICGDVRKALALPACAGFLYSLPVPPASVKAPGTERHLPNTLYGLLTGRKCAAVCNGTDSANARWRSSRIDMRRQIGWLVTTAGTAALRSGRRQHGCAEIWMNHLGQPPISEAGNQGARQARAEAVGARAKDMAVPPRQNLLSKNRSDCTRGIAALRYQTPAGRAAQGPHRHPRTSSGTNCMQSSGCRPLNPEIRGATGSRRRIGYGASKFCSTGTAPLPPHATSSKASQGSKNGGTCPVPTQVS